MVKTQQLFLLCLAYSSHAVLGDVTQQQPSANDWKASAASLIRSCLWKSVIPNSIVIGGQNLHALNIIEPVVLQVLNEGPVGETSLRFWRPSSQANFVNDNTEIANTAAQVDVDMVSLPMGEHVLYYAGDMKKDIVSSHFAIDSLLPQSKLLKSRLMKRNAYNNDGVAASKPEGFNAIVQWEIDPDHPKNEYKHRDNVSDDEDDEDEDDDDEDEDDDDEDEDDDEDGDDEDDYGDQEEDHKDKKNKGGDSWRLEKKEGWKAGKKKSKKIFLLSTVTILGVTSTLYQMSTVTTTATAGFMTEFVSVPGQTATIELPRDTITIVKGGLTTTINEPGFTSLIVIPGKTNTIQNPGKIITVNNPAVTSTILIGGAISTIRIAGATDTVQIPGFTTTITITATITATITDPGATVTEADATTETETVTDAGTTEPGVTETAPAETITIDGPPITVTADPVTDTVFNTLSGSTVSVTKYLLQKTVFVTVAFTARSQIIETIGSTATVTENVVVTVVRPRSSSTIT